MAWTQDDLTTLQRAIATGVRSVTFADGRRTEYQNADQMLAAVKVIAAELAGQASSDVRRRRRIIIGRVGCR